MPAHHPSDDSIRLSEVVERNRRNLIMSEITLMTTLCDLAETELRLGGVSRARRLLREATHAAQATDRHLRRWRWSADQMDELRNRLVRLERRLQSISRKAA